MVLKLTDICFNQMSFNQKMNHMLQWRLWFHVPCSYGNAWSISKDKNNNFQSSKLECGLDFFLSSFLFSIHFNQNHHSPLLFLEYLCPRATSFLAFSNGRWLLSLLLSDFILSCNQTFIHQKPFSSFIQDSIHSKNVVK